MAIFHDNVEIKSSTQYWRVRNNPRVVYSNCPSTNIQGGCANISVSLNRIAIVTGLGGQRRHVEDISWNICHFSYMVMLHLFTT